ncbi:hypothetical protein [uncultured Lamprocystis sp.]|jgi:hypothetical protein|uniref:hypothetical protein n=1 Tax=uncultured Lamprocystis sp. TaxID=543132 RepID=UPI0025E02F44|nr:hypothetical protein [uncultured Lamprocystis sp.]
MSASLRRRLCQLETDHQARTIAVAADHPARRWGLLNLYVRTAAGEDVTAWQHTLARLPPHPTTVHHELSPIERTQRVLALLCREARTSSAHRALLAVAVTAGLADPRQAQWMRETGLLTP